jgi:type IV secretion system protein VirD4
MMLLDEFAALGRIPIIAEAISYLPGYNVRVVMVMQTPAQLREVYGAHNAETMLKSLAARIVFAAKDHADAREISDELGYTTVRVKTISTPLFGFSGSKAQRSRSQNVSEQRRALLLPQEVKELGAEEAIIFYEGLRPRSAARRSATFRTGASRPGYCRRPSAPRRLTVPSSETPERRNTWSRRRPASSPPAESSHASVRGSPDHREATIADIDRLESLTLEDFAADFDRVKIPQKADGERLTSEELNAVVQSFLDTLKTR